MAFENLTIEAPDFDRIRKESGVHTADGMRLLWYALNDTRSQVRKVQAQLAWTDVPYRADTYSSAPGSWTVQPGDVLFYRTALLGNILFAQWQLQSTSTGAGMGSQLQIALPKGLTVDLGTAPGMFATSGRAHSLSPIALFANVLVVTDIPHAWILVREDGANWDSNLNNNLALEGFAMTRVSRDIVGQ